MATNATAQWWVRNDGADGNGGGYDSGIASAGTNYCDQASAPYSWVGNGSTTGLTLSGTTITDIGLTGIFTSAMIGSAINVPGQGYYWITAVTNSNTVTVTIGSGNASFTGNGGSVTAKLGGAFRNPYALSNGSGTVTKPGTSSALINGNTVNVRASGSGSVGSPDYTQTGYATYAAGTAAAGYVNWVAYNGTPYIKGNGLYLYNTTYHKWTGFYFTTSGNNFGTDGFFSSTNNLVLINCTVDANNQAVGGMGGAGGSAGTAVLCIGCTFSGGGTTSLSAITPNPNNNQVYIDCTIHGWGAWGVTEGANNCGTGILNCLIYSNTSGGVNLDSTSGNLASVVGCTIDNNGGDGIRLAGTTTCPWVRIVNNIISNNSGYGVNVNGGSTAVNNAAIAFENYNDVYNNTSGAYSNLTGGANDLAVNPNFVNAPTNYTPTNTALIACAPVAGQTSYLWMGAIQPAGGSPFAGSTDCPIYFN